MTDIRLTVYDHILETGRVPVVSEVADRASVPPEEVARELRRLQDIHAFALAPASDEILMAHPFSAVPTAHVVYVNGRNFWANCAWDAIAIPSMLGVDASIETRCGDCSETMTVRAAAGRLERDNGVVHFLVPPRHFWRNVGFT
jgi:Alkylmercury lyase